MPDLLQHHITEQSQNNPQHPVSMGKCTCGSQPPTMKMASSTALNDILLMLAVNVPNMGDRSHHSNPRDNIKGPPPLTPMAGMQAHCTWTGSTHGEAGHTHMSELRTLQGVWTAPDSMVSAAAPIFPNTPCPDTLGHRRRRRSKIAQGQGPLLPGRRRSGRRCRRVRRAAHRRRGRRRPSRRRGPGRGGHRRPHRGRAAPTRFRSCRPRRIPRRLRRDVGRRRGEELFLPTPTGTRPTPWWLRWWARSPRRRTGEVLLASFNPNTLSAPAA